ncbi:DUF2809 domain-containing protein [Microbacterium sp. SSM24]|uniref:DUF2809 domain-containing protein n=1 Tax=Microbacterium sp. SSM24 TaxID=2991714 RepID=UPI00222665E9|nr:DUF2809 domain-containing protein [Microbacterium sp. SSM24]MCW3494803.1 DUF2809 domain-containing protein [Microbacterium sp. SSM24]
MDSPRDAAGRRSANADVAPRGGRRGRRIGAVVLLVLVTGAGLSVHAFAPENAASDIAGDALYAAAAYFAVVMLAPSLRPIVVGAIAAGWCVAIELFQLTGIPLLAGAAFQPAMLLLGTVFDARDLVVYMGTVAALTGLDAATAVVVGRVRRR